MVITSTFKKETGQKEKETVSQTIPSPAFWKFLYLWYPSGNIREILFFIFPILYFSNSFWHSFDSVNPCCLVSRLISSNTQFIIPGSSEEIIVSDKFDPISDLESRTLDVIKISFIHISKCKKRAFQEPKS